MTDNHNYQTPAKGATDWHVPLNNNFEKIDADIEVRDTEANKSQYTAKSNSKFLATDTGAAYIGDGNSWNKVSTSGKSSVEVFAYESDDVGYAVHDSDTFTGSDIFAAIQKSVDSVLTSPGDRIDIMIKPGTYSPKTGLSFTNKGTNRVNLISPGIQSARINTENVSDEFVIEVNPGPVELGEFSDRIFRVSISGFDLDDTDDNTRTKNGIFVNDVSHLDMRNCRIRGYKRGIWIRNMWQGKVDHCILRECGNSAESAPAIQIGDPNDTATYQATNHLQLNHLQGDPGGNGFEHAYLQTYGRVNYIDISFPNVELIDGRGLVLTDGPRVNVRGAAITGGSPAIEVDGGRYQICGGYLMAKGPAISNSSGVPKLSVCGMDLRSADSNVLDLNQARLSMVGTKIRSGAGGLVMTNPAWGAVSGCYFFNQSQPSIIIQNGNWNEKHPVSLGNLAIKNSAGDSGNPVVIDNTDHVNINNISVSVDSSRSTVSAIGVSNSNNISITNVHPVSNISEKINQSDSSFRQFSGTATIPNGSRSVSVQHNLSAKPELGNVSATPVDDLGNATHMYINNHTDSSFDINIDSEASTDVRFGWSAEL